MNEYPAILIVEDNPDHLNLTELALHKELPEAQILRAATAAECQTTLVDISPDLIILDYSLPDMSGLELLKRVRETHEDVPVLMVTGQGNERIAVEAMKSGASDYIIKSDNYLTTLPATVRNILEHSQVKLRLQEQELYYRDLVENASDCIYLLDESGKIKLVNRAGTELSGYRRRQLIGRHFSILFEEREYRRLLHRVIRPGQKRKVKHLESWIISKDGEHIPVEVWVIPVKRAGRVIGYQGIVRDISEQIRVEAERLRRSAEIQRMNEELLEKNRRLQELDSLKTQFVSNVSHELRTPLNAILGYAELLREGMFGQLTPIQKQSLNNIIASGNHLLNLINQLLDFALIQNDKLKIYREPCSVYDLIDAAVATIRPAIEQKDLRFKKNIPEGLPHIIADGQKIFQVLLNLLSNAVKFTDQGEIELQVSRKDSYIEFEVRDTGIGIDQNDLDKIFEDFQQASGGMSRKYGGAGLGLSLARHFVKVHGGEIWVESRPGSGSSFHFTIPLETDKGGLEQRSTEDQNK